MLQEAFIELVQHYSSKEGKAVELWNEIATHYSNSKRHYHTLCHIENVLQQLLPVKQDIKEWNTLLFSVFYHDVIYNPLKTENEEKSAAFAANRMELISVPQPLINNCVNQIMATKKHAASADSDTNYFIDADLSILGQDWEMYCTYFRQVRKEYRLYPDIIFVPGRKKVVQHFLQMERIFKTEHFFTKYELQAKENLQQELDAL
jgi:predicted metal-dependent HD superfamily phosphohydrolase